MNEQLTPKASIVSVNISKQKNESKHSVHEIDIIKMGIIGDAHSGDPTKQICLFSNEAIEQLSIEDKRPYKPGDFGEHITTEGLDIHDIYCLDQLAIGSSDFIVRLEVTATPKENDRLYHRPNVASFFRDGVFCRVLHGGKIRPKDKIIRLPRTLSVQLIYVTRRENLGSSEHIVPVKLKTLLYDFFKLHQWTPYDPENNKAAISLSVISNDQQRLKTSLEKATSSYNMIFVIGSTGISPNDITPDVMERIADKKIPGIMESIHLDIGKKYPEVLIHRTMACTVGNSLVYTLPDHPIFIEEIFKQLQRFLEPSIFMLRGL